MDEPDLLPMMIGILMALGIPVAFFVYLRKNPDIPNLVDRRIENAGEIANNFLRLLFVIVGDAILGTSKTI